MNAAQTLAATALMVGILASMAAERARAYGLTYAPARWRAILTYGLALAFGAWLALRGSGGWPNSTVLACAAVSAVTDIETGYVFDRVLGSAAGLLLLFALCSGRGLDALLGAGLTGGVLLLPFACTRGRGIGLGDVKLAATLGLGLGSALALSAVWFACLSGGAAGALLLLLRRAQRKSEMRLGPFLAAGACLALARASVS